MKDWLKLKCRMRTSASWLRAPDLESKVWVHALLCARQDDGGLIPDPEDMAFELHRDEDATMKAYQWWESKGSLVKTPEGWKVANFGQEQADDEQAAKWREQKARQRSKAKEECPPMSAECPPMSANVRADKVDMSACPHIEETRREENRKERSVNAPAPVHASACEDRTESDLTDRPVCQFPVSVQSEPNAVNLGPKAFWVPRAWFAGGQVNEEGQIGAAIVAGMKLYKWKVEDLVGEMNILSVAKGREMVAVLLYRSGRWKDYEAAVNAVNREVDRWLDTVGGKKAAQAATLQLAEGGME